MTTLVQKLIESRRNLKESGLDTAEKRVDYAKALMREAKSTRNEGVARANQENAIRALLAAAEDIAKNVKMTKTASSIHTAWKDVDKEAVS
jgi:hypothetical protein